MRIADLIEVRSVPTIVDPTDIRDLRSTFHGSAPPFQSLETLRQLTEHYYVLDAHNRIALETTLQSLSGHRGAGFFINGVYGSGKSHFLALLALVLEFEEARLSFLRTHEEFQEEVHRLSSQARLIVFMSLEEYSPGRHSLEDVFWRQTFEECRQRGILLRKSAPDASRSEQFAELERCLSEAGYVGAVWLIDELSMFLGGRKHAELQRDASFLQFLGQRVARGPHWLIAALQKNVEDVGELDPYSLAQIRDRFQTRLMLSLAHVRTLIRGRLISHPCPEVFLHELTRIVDSLCARLPRLDVGVDDLYSTYPFHPASIELLEAAASRFFSRTRSALKFAQDVLSSVRCDAECTRLVTPDEIFDYFQPDIMAHPELRALNETVFRWYEQRVREFAPHDPDLALRLVKILIICKIGGVNPSIGQCANWALADCGLQGDENYSYVESILNIFISQGTFIAVDRRPDEFCDVVTIDLGARVNELARRRIANIAFAFEPNDSRISDYAFGSCDGDDWPLAPLSSQGTVWWQNSERRFLLERKDLRLIDTLEVKARIDALSEAIPEDAVLYLGHFFRTDAQREQWLRTLSRFKGGENERWARSLIALLPRELTRDELSRLIEFTASERLMNDPELRDNRRGRAILERLAAEQPTRLQETKRIVVRAFREGEVLLSAESSIRVIELIAEPDTLESLLIALSDHIFPQVFPGFPNIAPRGRLPGANTCDALALEILRVREPRTVPASTERMARTVLIPLGAANERRAQICVVPLQEPVRSAILHEIRSSCDPPTPLKWVEDKLRKSELGLPDGMTRIAIAALLREGEIVSEDASGEPLALDRVTVPLRNCISSVRRGQLLSREVWDDVTSVLKILCPAITVDAHSLGAQETAREYLLQWRDLARADGELTQSRLAQIRTMMPSSVERSFEFLRNWTGILYAIDDTPVASQVFSQMIERLKQQLGQEFRSVLGTWAREFKSLCSALDEHHRAAIDFHAYLGDVELVLSDDVLKSRHALAMGHLTAPGELTERMKTFCQAAFEFKQAHIEAYLRWHETVHSQERFSRVAELTNHPAIRVAGQMHKLTWIAMPGMPSLMQAVRSLSANICLQPALDQWLQRRPICPRCRLRLGENIRTASMTDLVNEAEIVIRDFISAFHESPVRERVVEFTQQSELPEVRDIASLLNVAADSSPDEILPILNDRTIDRLRFLMSPKRTVRRDIEALRLSFDGQTMTRSEAAMTFERWLDGEDELRDDDKVEFVIG